MSEEKHVNLVINDGQDFYANESSINFNPMQIILDFKNITPRIDQRSENPTIVLRHNVVILEPFHVKQFHKMLTEAIERYEKEFGKIEKPKNITKIERKQAKSAEEHKLKERKHDATYFG